MIYSQVGSYGGWLYGLRQANRKNRAAFWSVGDDNLPALSLNKTFDNRQAEAAASCGRRWRAKEFVENLGQEFRREAGTLIGDTYFKTVVLVPRINANGCSGWSVNRRIQQEIGKALVVSK